MKLFCLLTVLQNKKQYQIELTAELLFLVLPRYFTILIEYVRCSDFFISILGVRLLNEHICSSLNHSFSHWVSYGFNRFFLFGLYKKNYRFSQKIFFSVQSISGSISDLDQDLHPGPGPYYPDPCPESSIKTSFLHGYLITKYQWALQIITVNKSYLIFYRTCYLIFH